MTEIREGRVCQGKRIVKGGRSDEKIFDKVAEKKNGRMKAEKRDDTHE